MSIQLAAQYASQILSLECYANGFVKIVQECRGTNSYLKGYFYSKLRNFSKQKPWANTVSTTRTTLLWPLLWNQITSIHQTDFVFVPFLSKQILTKQNIIASTEISFQFLATKVPILRRNKVTNSSTSNHPFFSCNENPCACWFIPGFSTCHHIRTGYLPLGHRDKEKDDNPLILLIIPICKLPVRMVKANAFEKSLNEWINK